MAEEISYFKRIAPHLEKKYGGEKARAIMSKARERYGALVEENKDEPEEWHIHTQARIYPGIAMFDAMTGHRPRRNGGFHCRMLQMARGADGPESQGHL